MGEERMEEKVGGSSGISIRCRKCKKHISLCNFVGKTLNWRIWKKIQIILKYLVLLYEELKVVSINWRIELSPSIALDWKNMCKKLFDVQVSI